MKADRRPIGLFDSGVGGLSVLLEIKKILPLENFVFLADQKNVPYGSKSKKELRDLCDQITEFLLVHKIKMLVVACNTATCYAIDHLRKKFDIPIVGVVPAVKPAVLMTKNNKIVIMSTPATAKSAYLVSLVKNFASKKKVLRLGCKGLEEAIEYLNYQKISKLLDKYTNRIKNFGADVVVLGCTHYPLIRDEIQKELGSKINVLDSGEAIAKQVKRILGEDLFFSNRRYKDYFYSSGNPIVFSKIASKILKSNVIAGKANI